MRSTRKPVPTHRHSPVEDSGFHEFEVYIPVDQGEERGAASDKHRMRDQGVFIDQARAHGSGGKRCTADADGADELFLEPSDFRYCITGKQPRIPIKRKAVSSEHHFGSVPPVAGIFNLVWPGIGGLVPRGPIRAHGFPQFAPV